MSDDMTCEAPVIHLSQRLSDVQSDEDGCEETDGDYEADFLMLKSESTLVLIDRKELINYLTHRIT